MKDWLLVFVCAGVACGGDGVAVADGSSGGATGSTTQPSTSTTTTTTTTQAETASGSSSGSETTSEPQTGSTVGSTDATSGSSTSGTTESPSTGTGSGSTDGSSSSSGVVDCTVGERVYMGDGCNFCDCTDAGLDNCTTRTCVSISDGCSYEGVDYGYAEVFDASDDCNVCVCAASGLACTRRSECGDFDEGAILLEGLDEPCGDIEEFTGQWVLDWLESDSWAGPLDYNNDGMPYPEVLPDTSMRVRVHGLDGYIVCRIPAPGQEAIDMEAIIEWATDDGAFDEGQHTYIRRNYGGFLMAVTSVATVDPENIHGTYDHSCLDAGTISLGLRWNDDGTGEGIVSKVCEVDFAVTLGDWTSP